MNHTFRAFAAGLALGVAGAAPASAQDTPPAGAAAPYTSVDSLLDALEVVDRTMRTLTADLVYDRTFELEGDRQTRAGKVFFEAGPEGGARRFAIAFDTLIVGTRRENEPKVYIFDGHYLVEKLPAEKLFVKREVVKPGETFDALKIGEGPFPIPIGQKKSDILARYEAELREIDDGIDVPELKARVVGATQLFLKPRAGSAADEEFREIRIWYRTDGRPGSPLLPRMARTVNRNGDVSRVLLLNVAINSPIPDGVLDTTAPTDGWDVRVEPYRERAVGATEAK